MVIVLGSILIPGCLDKEDTEGKTGISALSVRSLADKEKGNHTGDLELVVVTAVDPTSEGNSLSWKFAYNDVTSGIALRSLLVTIDEENTVTLKFDDALSKSPIKNWTIDSVTAYSKARSKLIDEKIIGSSVKISVKFLYLLGEDEDNHGCEWTIGMVLGSEQSVEALVRVDGRYGNVLEIVDSKS